MYAKVCIVWRLIESFNPKLSALNLTAVLSAGLPDFIHRRWRTHIHALHRTPERVGRPWRECHKHRSAVERWRKKRIDGDDERRRRLRRWGTRATCSTNFSLSHFTLRSVGRPCSVCSPSQSVCATVCFVILSAHCSFHLDVFYLM